MLCTRIYPGHASLATIRRDFGHEFTARKFPNPPKFIVDLPQSVLECGFNAQRCVWSRCGFRSLYTNEFWQCLRRMLCASCTSDTHFQRRIVVISVMNSQYVSFRILPKFIVHLPQSMFECTFNTAYSMLRYVQETLITFPLILFALCSLCMRMIRFECLRHAGCIFMAHLLSRQLVSFPAKPLDLMQLSN